jgi:hypothetical protein
MQYGESHPAKPDPDFATAVKVTAVPLSKLAEQVDPQSMPTGRLVTDPLPNPEGETVKVY